MGRARYLVEAVVVEGRSITELARSPRGLPVLDLQAAGSLQSGRLLSPGAPFPAA
jgi:hypothetical protein